MEAHYRLRRRKPRRNPRKLYSPLQPWLLDARAWGLGHLDDLAGQASQVTGTDRGACREYLSGLDYGLSFKHLEGLTSFLRRLVTRGMVREAALAFLSVA